MIAEGDIMMFDRFKEAIFKIIPPSRQFMDRKFEENEELLRSTIIQETENMHREISDVAEEIRKSNLLHADMLKELKNAVNQVNSNQEKLQQRQDEIVKLINAVGDEVQKVNLKQDAIFDENAKLIKDIGSSFDETAKSINDQIVTSINVVKEINDATSKMTMDQKNLMDKYNVQIDKITLLGRIEEENTWSNVFHDVIKDSVWLRNKAFAPGRWAAGYQMLYVMYRIMDSVKPKKILELGLGQTTRMISQYSGYYHAEHQVVEHDPKWIEFFATTYEVPDNVKFVNLDTVVDKYLDDEEVIMYQGFEEQFRGQKFDFICIDAPLGGKAIKYARVDILKILPDCLEPDFVLLIDDTERIGETNTIKLLQKTFEENGIEYVMKRYDGRKSSTIFTTEKYSFLTSL